MLYLLLALTRLAFAFPTRWALQRVFPGLRGKRFNRVFWGSHGVIEAALFVLGYGWYYARTGWGWYIMPYFAWYTGLWAVQGSVSLVWGIGWLLRRFRSAPPSVDAARRKAIAKTGLLLAGVSAAIVAEGVLRGRYRFTVRERTLAYPNLPWAFDGLRILQLSDLHVGSFSDQEALRSGLALAAAQQPDLFLFTGDLVNATADELHGFGNALETLRMPAPLGRFASLGNHDFGTYAAWLSRSEQRQAARAIQAAYSDLGFTLLRNQHTVLTRGKHQLALVGVDNWSALGKIKRADLNAACRGLDANTFKVLLSHDPSYWDYAVRPHPLRFELTLSGHTHGAQCGVDVGDYRWSPISLVHPRWADLYREGNENLYVNRGFGYVLFPGRIGVLPEITVLTLRRARA